MYSLHRVRLVQVASDPIRESCSGTFLASRLRWPSGETDTCAIIPSAVRTYSGPSKSIRPKVFAWGHVAL